MLIAIKYKLKPLVNEVLKIDIETEKGDIVRYYNAPKDFVKLRDSLESEIIKLGITIIPDFSLKHYYQEDEDNFETQVIKLQSVLDKFFTKDF